MPGYLEEDGIPPDSITETYAAVRLDIDTRRWAGVPFYLRTGKRLPAGSPRSRVVFKRAPHLPFEATATEELGQNALVIRVQPDEGITLRFGSKVPGTAMEVRDVTMDFAYGEAFTESSPEAYERLILDVLIGEAPLFPRHEEVELSWRILDPIEEFWAGHGQARAVPGGHAGARPARTRCSPATAAPGAGFPRTCSRRGYRGVVPLGSGGRDHRPDRHHRRGHRRRAGPGPAQRAGPRRAW